MSGLRLTCSVTRWEPQEKKFPENQQALGIPNDHKADLDASGEVSETNACVYMDISAAHGCNSCTSSSFFRPNIWRLPKRRLQDIEIREKKRKEAYSTWLWKSFVAVTAPVNEDVHSKSHLCVFAFNETKTLGPTRVSKNSNFCSCSEVLWRSKQLTSWKDSAFSAVLYQGSDLTFIVVSNQSLLIQAFACRGMSSPSCQVAIVSFFTFWRGGGVLLIFLDQFAKAFNCESTLATNNLQLIYRVLLAHLYVYNEFLIMILVCMLNRTMEQDHHLDLYGFEQFSKQINLTTANGDPSAKLRMFSAQLHAVLQTPITMVWQSSWFEKYQT